MVWLGSQSKRIEGLGNTGNFISMPCSILAFVWLPFLTYNVQVFLLLPCLLVNYVLISCSCFDSRVKVFNLRLKFYHFKKWCIRKTLETFFTIVNKLSLKYWTTLNIKNAKVNQMLNSLLKRETFNVSLFNKLLKTCILKVDTLNFQQHLIFLYL